MVGFSFFFFIWVRFVEPNVLSLEELEFNFSTFPDEEITILHLSDLHSFGYGEKEKKLVNAAKRLDPDFIFITGDLVDWRTSDFEECALFWRDLSQGFEGRVFAVYGNHEHKNPGFARIGPILERSGIRVLENERIKIELERGGYFYLLGVDDPRLGYDNVSETFVDPYIPGPKILLAHSPEIFRKVKKKEVDLVLVGHTHGCQINVPIVREWFLPLAYDKGYKQGLFEESGTYLYVNRGVGETYLPFRFNSFPEVTLITINKESDS